MHSVGAQRQNPGDAETKMMTAESLKGKSAPLLNRQTGRLLLHISLAAGALTLLLWKRSTAPSPFDPVSLALTGLSIATALTALRSLVILVRRIALSLRASKYTLTIGDTLTSDVVDQSFDVPREDVLDILEIGDWGSKSANRYADIFVMTRPREGAAIRVVPPIFDAPGALKEQLMRWRKPPPKRELPEPSKLPSKVYEAATRGEFEEGTSVVRHGWGWLRRGPFAALIAGIAFLIEAMLMPEGSPPPGILPFGAMLLCFAFPLVWLLMMRRHITPRKGLALVFTPAEALMRTPGGVVRAPWKEVTRMHVSEAPAWSVLTGLEPQRHLVFDRQGDTPIRYDEAFLGAPAEAVCALAEVYRRGSVLAADSAHTESE